MIKRALVMLGAAALTFMAFTGVASAQEQMAVNIPFDFVAGNKTLPAGEYYVRSADAGRTLLLVDRRDSSVSVYLPAIGVVAQEAQSQSKVVFNRYGERYFLAQVWSQGNIRGSQLIKSGREREFSIAAKSADRNQVTLVATLR